MEEERKDISKKMPNLLVFNEVEKELSSKEKEEKKLLDIQNERRERKHKNEIKKIEYFSQEKIEVIDDQIAEAKLNTQAMLEKLKELQKKMNLDQAK